MAICVIIYLMSIAVHQDCQEWLLRTLTARGCPADQGACSLLAKPCTWARKRHRLPLSNWRKAPHGLPEALPCTLCQDGKHVCLVRH